MPDIGVALATAAAPTVKQFLQSVTKPKYDEFIALYTKAFNGFLDTSRQRYSMPIPLSGMTRIKYTAAIALLGLAGASMMTDAATSPMTNCDVP